MCPDRPRLSEEKTVVSPSERITEIVNGTDLAIKLPCSPGEESSAANDDGIKEFLFITVSVSANLSGISNAPSPDPETTLADAVPVIVSAEKSAVTESSDTAPYLMFMEITEISFSSSVADPEAATITPASIISAESTLSAI